MFTGKWGKVFKHGGEAKRSGQFKQEAEVEIAEVAFHCIQGENRSAAPVEKALFIGTILDSAVEDFAEEHGHGVLQQIGTYPVQGIFCGDVPQAPQIGFRIFYDFCVKHVEGEEKSHPGIL